MAILRCQKVVAVLGFGFVPAPNFYVRQRRHGISKINFSRFISIVWKKPATLTNVVDTYGKYLWHSSHCILHSCAHRLQAFAVELSEGASKPFHSSSARRESREVEQELHWNLELLTSPVKSQPAALALTLASKLHRR